MRLLSSVGELGAMRDAELHPLDLEAASRTDYDPTRYQPVLFCADSFRELRLNLGDFLASWRG